VVGPNSPGGVLDTDLRSACLAALKLPRDEVYQHARQYTWRAATEQFVQALQPIVRASSTPALAAAPSA
jgi:hypothetical protein